MDTVFTDCTKLSKKNRFFQKTVFKKYVGDDVSDFETKDAYYQPEDFNEVRLIHKGLAGGPDIFVAINDSNREFIYLGRAGDEFK